jgi:hypothetical protein
LDISVLIPQDYIQLEMDWDPVAFMPGVREFLLPEIDKLHRMGATVTSLATLQSMVASWLEDTSPFFHWIHFGFNGLTVGLVSLLASLLVYRVLMVYRARPQQRQARQVDLAIRTALNRGPSNPNLYVPDGSLTLDNFDASSITSQPTNLRNHPNRISYRPNSLHKYNTLKPVNLFFDFVTDKPSTVTVLLLSFLY